MWKEKEEKNEVQEEEEEEEKVLLEINFQNYFGYSQRSKPE